MFILLYLACPQPTPAPSICTVDPNWITRPKMPTEVAKSETFCDFYQFSWQAFLAQMSPTSAGEEPLFFENRVYAPGGGDNQCNQKPITGLLGAASQLNARRIKPSRFEDVQADGHALYDQNGSIIFYNAFYSQQLCSSTKKGFASGTLEAKVSWKILKEGTHHDYFVMNATIPNTPEEVTLGLVGLHLAIWTPHHPEMIWVTWEHKLNAPLCNGSSMEKGWAFASDNASTCLNSAPTPQSGPPNKACESFEFNVPPTFTEGKAPIKSSPVNVCREYALGNQDGVAVNGNDNEANRKAIQQLNEQLVGEKGFLTLLPPENPLSVWSNYEMVGGLWTKNGADSGTPPIPSKQGKANKKSPQRGSLELANMTMETFQQGGQSFVPNCFGCHNYKKSDPLSVSHIQNKLLPQEPKNAEKKKFETPLQE